MKRLKKRSDFIAAAKGKKARGKSFVLQWRCRDERGPTRIGFTVTKRTARKAVERNRIRRRLKEAVRLVDPQKTPLGKDLVLIGRRAALDEPFESLRSSIEKSFEKATSCETERSDPAPGDPLNG